MQTYLALALSFIIIIYVLWNLKKLYPQKFKGPFPKEVYPSKTELRITMVSILLISLIMFSMSSDSALEAPTFPVRSEQGSNTEQRLIIKDFDKVAITGEPFLQSKETSFRSNLIALLINDDKAFLNSLGILIICVLATVGLWNFDFKDPFRIRLSRTFYQIGIVVIIYGLVSYLSDMLANSYTLSTTNNEFAKLHGIPFSFLFKVWFGSILMRIGQVFRNAEKLKKEQDLTI